MNVGPHAAGQSLTEQKRVLFADMVFHLMAVNLGHNLFDRHVVT